MKESKLMGWSCLSLVIGFILLIFGGVSTLIGLVLIILSYILAIVSEKYK